MADLTKILLAALGGVCIFSIQKIIESLFIETINQYKKHIGHVDYLLTLYASDYLTMVYLIGNDKPLPESLFKASQEFRDAASRLRSLTKVIPFYKVISKIIFLPSYENSIQASRELIGLSNGVFRKDSGDENRERAKKISELLKLEYYD